MACADAIIPHEIQEVVFPHHSDVPAPVEPNADDLVEELLEELLDGLDLFASTRGRGSQPGQLGGGLLDEEADRAFRTSFVLADEICSLGYGLSKEGEDMVAMARGLRSYMIDERPAGLDEVFCGVGREDGVPPAPRLNSRAVLLIRRGREIVARLRAVDLGRVYLPA